MWQGSRLLAWRLGLSLQRNFSACSTQLSCAEAGGRSSDGWGCLYTGVPLALASGVAIACSGQGFCDSRQPDSFASPVRDVKLALFKNWLREHGADVDAVDVKTCQDASKGLGLHATDDIKQKYRGGAWRALIRWVNPWRQSTIMSIPSELFINEATVVRDERIGRTLQRHIEAGNIDGREAVMLWLVLHRAMGAGSPFHPYISILPSTFDTPLYYSEDDLQHIAGTSLLMGTQAAKAGLSKSWSYIEPVLRELLSAAGMHHCKLTLDDYRWAYSLFWSRCLALPVPIASGNGKSTEFAEIETLVPGVDVANHDSHARCHWRVTGTTERSSSTAHSTTRGASAQEGSANEGVARDGSAKGSQGGSDGAAASLGGRGLAVQVVARNWGGPQAGDEVCIQYGDTSNDALMFAHGFAEVNNLSDTVLLRFPLPPSSEWDDVLRARLLLLREKGLGPQVVLKRLSKRDAKAKGDALQLPPEARATLEILVMTTEDLLKHFDKADAGDESPEAPRLPSAALGLEMAMLTTFCRLLETKLYEMEGENGTGPLERDVALIERGQGDMPPRQWHSLLYRASQKRIVREYLTRARDQLQSVMREMQRAVDRELSKRK